MKHYLVDQTDFVELAPEKPLSMGRTQENDIVVNDKSASRQHARIEWNGMGYTVTDLKSRNGTRVNGNAVDSVLLKDGDQLEFGSQVYVYRIVKSADELSRSMKTHLMEQDLLATAQIPAAGESIPEDDFGGAITTMPLTDICQTLGLGQRTGTLMLNGASGFTGQIWFQQGRIVRAVAGDLQGDDAVFAILATETGFFRFTENADPVERNVQSEASFLLLEAVRRKDEG